MSEIEKTEKYTINQLRSLKGLTREELSRKSGVTSRTIFSYETSIEKLRSAKYSSVEKLAKTLGVKVGDIFLDPVSEKPKQVN